MTFAAGLHIHNFIFLGQ